MSATRVGNYEIVEVLARGGMAVVYLVRQPALDREVVLKRLDIESDDPTLAQRFVQEARLAATLNHPNVVTLFDFFEDDGVPYIAMEYVDGGSLRSIIGTLRLPQIYGLVEGILAGLGHAEGQGIAHRDLKPENVLLTRRGGVKIADFGIARAYNALTQRLTTTGMAIGTPAYMAPEQALNEPLGPYTDLYALGVIVYELLAGRPPFDADTPVGVLYCHVHKRPPPLADVVPGAQPALCEWVEWLLAKAPSERPRSAAEAWNALEESAVAELGPYWRRAAAISPPASPAGGEPAHAEEPPTTAEGTTSLLTPDPTRRVPAQTPLAVPPAPHDRGPPRRGRRRRIAAVAGLVGLAGAAAAVALLPRARDEEPPPPPDTVASATPYDFDGDGRQELVIALLRGSPRGASTTSGVVLVHRGRGSDPAWSVITQARAGVPGRPQRLDDFGSGLASADFDGDGHADLAIGTPGKDRVSVLYGGARGLLAGPRQQLAAADARLPAGAGGYGYLLLARNVDDDRFGDLVVSAPGEPLGQAGAGALHVLFGGAGGLRSARSRTIRRPVAAFAGFGTRLRSGDVDGDGRIDLVEGSPTHPLGPGHASYCPGSERGPLRCRELGASSGTSSLAVGDVNGDRYADIIQGDSGRFRAAIGLVPTGGEVRVWLGSRRGPSTSPVTITQSTPLVPGTDEPGDEFGALVEAGDLDSDGVADMIVGSTGEDGGAGRITVIRGGRGGYARTGHGSFGQDDPAVPGRAQPDGQFGSSVTVLLFSDDRRLDVAVAARGEATADARVMVVEGGAGVFAPDETRTSTLPGVAAQVRSPKGGRIRLARTERG